MHSIHRNIKAFSLAQFFFSIYTDYLFIVAFIQDKNGVIELIPLSHLLYPVYE